MEKIIVSSDKNLLIIFTYAPAGLGHLRVVNTLSEGVETKGGSVLMGSYDSSIETIHKFISINHVARNIMEWVQRGTPQTLFTYFYRNYLRNSSSSLYRQVERIFDERVDIPKNVIFVCTHFGLAHQLAVIKERLEKEKDIKIKLIVQVTDDSPQYIWYVPGADLISVPSEQTKLELLKYADKSNLPLTKIVVLPYPVSRQLTELLSENRLVNRIKQLQARSEESLNIAIPVSGAAVDMGFYYSLINRLNGKYHSFNFYIVSRRVPFTKKFLDQIINYKNVTLYESKHDREVVDLYDDLYRKVVIGAEITKPSEQAFKALLSTHQVGGSILLFSKPVGRQEYDNLDFLRRHGLLFSQVEHEFLWSKSEKSESLGENELMELFGDKGRIRALELPWGSENTANFIWWALKQGVLEKMMEHGSYKDPVVHHELGSDGVKQFWRMVKGLI
jgi:hypothetical protein